MESIPISWTNLIELKESLIKDISNDLSGAFRLSYKHDNGNIYVFYVGQSENLKSHLLSFFSENNSNFCVKEYIKTSECYFRYADIKEEHYRKAAERAMFKRYVPPCNKSIPDGRDDIEINFS